MCCSKVIFINIIFFSFRSYMLSKNLLPLVKILHKYFGKVLLNSMAIDYLLLMCIEIRNIYTTVW